MNVVVQMAKAMVARWMAQTEQASKGVEQYGFEVWRNGVKVASQATVFAASAA